MTTQTAPTARNLIPAIANADQALAEHASRRPAEITIWHGGGYQQQHAPWVEWQAEHDRLAAIRNTALRDAQGLICQRCDGRGVTGWLHRFNGECFRCRGDGWTVRGRKWWATQH